MAKKDVQIHIQTTADPKAVQGVNQELVKTEAAAKRAGGALKEVGAVAAPATQLADESERAAIGLKKTGEEAGKAASGSGNNGMGLLMFGQAVEDAQYGLRGVMNNIPGVVMSLGLGAGAAGVLQVALVGVSQMLDLLSAKAKGVETKPLIGQLTLDDRYVKEMEGFIKLMDRQKEAIERRNTALENGNKAVRLSIDYVREMQGIQDARDDADFISTGDPVQDAQKRRQMAVDRLERDASLRASERQDQAQSATAQEANAAGDLGRVDAQYQEQQKFLEGVKKRALLERRMADLQKGIAEDMRNLQGTFADPIADFEGFKADLAEMVRGGGDDSETAKSLTAKQAEYAALQAQLRPGALPALPGFAPTGDATKDDEKKKEIFAREEERLRELEKRRADALAAAESAKQKAEAERLKLAREQALDEERTKDTRADIEAKAKANIERAIKDPAAAAAAANEPENPAYTEDKAARQDFANEQASAALAGLDELRQKAGSNPELQAKIQEMVTLLTDRDGATARDLEQVTNFLSQSRSDIDRAMQGNAQNARTVAEIARAAANAIDALRNDLNGALAEIRANRSSSRF
jgi:hypothetical protein